MKRLTGFGGPAVGVAAFVSMAAAAPLPTDFVVSAEFAVGLLAEGASRRDTADGPAIVTGSEARNLSSAEYRRQRSECALNRLIRIQGRSEIGAEWRCGPLNARWYDVYTVEDRRVVRVDVNVPLLVTSQPAAPERR